MEELLATDLSVVQAGLRRRFIGPAYPGVRAVGLGVATKGDQPDPSREQSVVFYVDKKATPRQKQRRLPPTVLIGVLRGGRRKFITLPTDVMELGPVVPSGLPLDTPKTPSARDSCTAGVVLGWQNAAGDDKIGLLTVGHAFGTPASLGPNLFVGVGPIGPAAGILIDKASVAATDVDAAVVQIHGPPGVVLPLPLRFPGLPAFSLAAAQSAAHAHAPGVTCRIGGDVTLQLEVFFQYFLLNSVGDLANVIRARSPIAGAFAPGSSGAVWAVVDSAGVLRPFAIQVATDRSQADRVGYAQVLDNGAFAWVVTRLLTVPGVVAGTIVLSGVV